MGERIVKHRLPEGYEPPRGLLLHKRVKPFDSPLLPPEQRAERIAKLTADQGSSVDVNGYEPLPDGIDSRTMAGMLARNILRTKEGDTDVSTD